MTGGLPRPALCETDPRYAKPLYPMTFTRLHEVTDLLPFHLDETEQVNQAFLRWRQSEATGDKRLVDTWTYCYIYRYFLVKMAPSASPMPLALDRLVANAFDDVQGSLHSIHRPGCYTNWVSTICRNTFVSHLRTQRSTVSLEIGGPLLIDEPPPVHRSARRLGHLQVDPGGHRSLAELPPRGGADAAAGEPLLRIHPRRDRPVAPDPTGLRQQSPHPVAPQPQAPVAARRDEGRLIIVNGKWIMVNGE